MHCLDCGGFLKEIKSGGYGGLGSVYRCTDCKSLWEQESGGMFVSGRVSLRKIPEWQREAYEKEAEDKP